MWCRDLEKTYRTATGVVHALRGVDAEFPQGALCVVAGPSGSGKSSLLRILGALDRPSAGRASTLGVHLSTARPTTLRRLRRAKIGYVLQRPSDNFFPYLTLRDHVRIAAGRSDSGMDPLSALEAVGLSERDTHLPNELSGGEQQRAAFAQLLAGGARVGFADEPTAELDESSAADLLGSVKGLGQLGMTIVVASHDPSIIRAADVLLELQYGRAKGRRRADVWSPVARPAATTTPPEPRPDAGGGSVIRVTGARRHFRHGSGIVRAVDGVDITVRAGELIGVVGRSGSGKTTLLNLIAGWETTDSGRIKRPGGDAPTWSDVSVLPQRLGLMEELTVRENVEYPARLTGRLQELATAVDKLLDELDLRHLEVRYPSEISVGEQQRAALARALVLSPRVVLADEPTGHQDHEAAAGMIAALRTAAAGGSACLVATHDPSLRAQLDRSLELVDGRIRSNPPPATGS